jgi:preprotein translocase subunit SecG
MSTIIIVIHLILAVALIGVVLLQKSEGGALGMGGGGMSGFMSGRSTANLLTRTTAILAAAFFATSIALAVIAGAQRATHSIIDQAPAPAAPAKPAAPAQPATPAAPSVPLAK